MGAGRKTETINVSGSSSSRFANSGYNSEGIARNLHKADLGGVIFGCKHNTISECLSKQIFGLPRPHISYVANIEPGLPLFLFNYSNQMLHGIYESASHGDMDIDPYAWTEDGKEKTAFPAQVRIRIKAWCQPIPEKMFRPRIEDNYYTKTHFYFELDHKQAKSLASLFTGSLQIENNSKKIGKNPARAFSTYNNMPGYKVCTACSVKHAKDADKRNKHPISWADLASGNQYAFLSCDEDNDCSTKGSSTIAEDGETKETDNRQEHELEKLWSDNRQTLEHDLAKSQHSEEELWSNNTQSFPLDPNDISGEIQNEQEFNDNNSNIEMERILNKLKKLARTPVDPIGKIHEDELAVSSAVNWAWEISISEQVKEGCKKSASACDSVSENDVEFTREHSARSVTLEDKLIDTQREVEQLRKVVENSDQRYKQLQERIKVLEAEHDPSVAIVEESLNKSMVEQVLGSECSIYLIGGYNGEIWLNSLDSYSPLRDVLTPLKPMSCPRSLAAASSLGGCFYIFGGCVDKILWYDTVECYNPRNDEWTTCPSLARANGNLAGATLKGKIYAIGGGDGREYFSRVEMFDPVLGRWIGSQSMLEKRFALAASELNDVLYAAGGFNGENYLSSAERFDPRQGFWSKIPSMSKRRSRHSSVVFNEKVYVLGGYDGEQMVSSVELFDPRAKSWLTVDPMNAAREHAGTAALGGSLYVIGGVEDLESATHTVEVYREGEGWTVIGSKAVGKRSFFSTVVLE